MRVTLLLWVQLPAPSSRASLPTARRTHAASDRAVLSEVSGRTVEQQSRLAYKEPRVLGLECQSSILRTRDQAVLQPQAWLTAEALWPTNSLPQAW